MSRGQVLVVDDQVDMRFLVRALLTCEGFEVAETDSGDAAVAIVREGPVPQLVVLDNELGEARRGVDLAPVIKSLSPSTRVVLFSAAVDTGTALEAVDLALNKLDVSDLPRVVRELLAGLVDVAA